VLATVIRDVYTTGEREDVRHAVNELCSPADNAGFAGSGVYSYWDPRDGEVLYVGLARDLAERFRQHNLGSVPAPGGQRARSTKRLKIDDWFDNEHSHLGFSIVVQASHLQAPARRGRRWMDLESHAWKARGLDYIREAIRDPGSGEKNMVLAEGRLIESCRNPLGKLPSWNAIAGAKRGAATVSDKDFAFAAFLSNKADSSFVARWSIRHLGLEESWYHEGFEETLHALRMLLLAGIDQADAIQLITGEPISGPIALLRLKAMAEEGYRDLPPEY
jgi:hypothetical protein